MALAALLLAEQGRDREAAVYLGLSRSQQPEATGFMDRWQQLTAVQRDLQQRLGADAFQAAWQRGAAQDLVAAAGLFLAALDGGNV